MSYRLAVAILCLAEFGFAQAVWSQRVSGSVPTSGTDVALTYDAQNKNVVLFGNDRRDETWVWDGTDWQMVATTGPCATSSNKMVYDTSNARVLPVSSSSPMGTWAWDGAQWTRLTTPTVPPSRSGFGLAYDTRRGVAVLFGGVAGNGDRADTSEFDGADWRQRSSGGPFPRRSMEMVYDEARGEVVLFAGQNDTNQLMLYSDTWVWDGRVWSEHFGIAAPPKRVYAGMGYDAKRQVVVMSGGTTRQGTVYNDTWEWNGATWTQVYPTTNPTRDRYGEMAYDPEREVVVFHLGNSQGTETWEYTNRPLPSATWARFGAGCAGSAGTPLLDAGPSRLPRLGERFDVELTNLPNHSFVRAFGLLGVSDTSWLSLSLPLDLGFAGMPGCNLLMSMNLTQDLAIVNGKATWSFDIPNEPGLAGGRFFLQGLVFEPGVNALGAIVSNGGAAGMGL